MKAPEIPSFLEPTPSPVTLTPVDAIHPSEKDASVDASEDVRVSIGTESLDASSVSGEVENVLKSLVPLETNKDWQPWFVDYLRSLMETRTDLDAVALVGLHPQAVWEAMMNHVDFAKAVDKVKTYRDWMLLSKIEDSTLKRAIDSDPADRSSATLGIFHLKARDEKYKDKQQPGQTAIHINIGYQIPPTKRHHGPISDAQFDE